MGTLILAAFAFWLGYLAGSAGGWSWRRRMQTLDSADVVEVFKRRGGTGCE